MKFLTKARSLSVKRMLQSRPALVTGGEIHRLRAENARYRSLFDAAPIGHFTLDTSFRILEINSVGAAMLGTSAEDLHRTSFISNIISADRISVSNLLSEIAKVGERTVSTSLQVSDNTIPVMLHLNAVYSSQQTRESSDYSFHVAILDLSEHHEAQNNLRIARDGLQHVAHHDPLTRLPNRCGLLEQLRLTLDTESNSKTALLLLDLDHFKQVNDPLGHHIGDKLLREVASRLLNTVSEIDTVGRLGGDEFAIILRDISTASDATVIAEKITDAIGKQYLSALYDIRLSASIGISVFPDHADNPKQLLSFADAAMNQAKQRGRNLIQFYTTALNTRLTERFELERDLRVALRESQFELYFQPQYDIRTTSVTGYEVLLRWNHPEQGIIGPESFIEIVEETGLIDPLGDWILSESCNKLVEIRRNNPNIKFSVNVSAKQFVTGNLQDRIARILQTTGVPANAIELELTESALLENGDHSLNMLQDLRAAGVDLAIDDFGTGYSSFSRLQKLPVTRVKIDRSFVQDIPDNHSNCSIVKAIISVAHELGIEVVAEGVETRQQLEFLKAAACDILQGYYVGRPCTFEQINENASFNKEESDLAVA